MLGNKILETRKSKYNGEIVVKKTLGLGTYIQVGGITQSGKIIEQIWKKALKRVKNEKIESCLVLGLGGGSVAGLLRKYFPKAKIIGVEIDPVMVGLGKKYLGLNDNNVEIIIQDAKTYKLPANTYDLVIVDTYLGREYVEIAGALLAGSGIVMVNKLGSYDENFKKKLEKLFGSVETVEPLANTIYIC